MTSAKLDDVRAGDGDAARDEFEVDDRDHELDDDFAVDGDDDRGYGYPDEFSEPVPARPRRYRPGRGGFDPEAAELAARAKYAFRQRVVLLLLLLVVGTGVAAGVFWPLLWWAHSAVDLVLVAYLVYLRRQVRIEEDIRQRRLARYREAAQRAPRRPDPLAEIDEIEVRKPDGPGIVASERKPVPTSRLRRQAVVVDPDDEDPAFHELDDPGRLPYRRAAGE